MGFSVGSDGKESACNVGDPGSFYIYILKAEPGEAGWGGKAARPLTDPEHSALTLWISGHLGMLHARIHFLYLCCLTLPGDSEDIGLC